MAAIAMGRSAPAQPVAPPKPPAHTHAILRLADGVDSAAMRDKLVAALSRPPDDLYDPAGVEELRPGVLAVRRPEAMPVGRFLRQIRALPDLFWVQAADLRPDRVLQARAVIDGTPPDLAWVQRGELALTARIQPPEGPGGTAANGEVVLPLGARALVLKPGTEVRARAELRRGDGGRGLLLDHLDIAVEPYLRVRDAVWKKDIGIAGLRIGPEGLAVEAVLLDIPLLNRIPGVRRIATWKKSFVLEAFEPLADGQGLRLRIRGLPDIELRVDAERRFLVRGSEVTRLPAGMDGGWLKRLKFPLDIEGLLADLAPLLAGEGQARRAGGSGGAAQIALCSELQLQMRIASVAGTLTADAHARRKAMGEDGLLRQSVSLDLALEGGLPERLRLPLSPGKVDLELGRKVSFQADGEARLPLGSGVSLAEAIRAASWRGLTRVSLPLEAAHVDLGGTRIAVDGPVEVELASRDFFRPDGVRPMLVDMAVQVAPGTAVLLHGPGPLGQKVELAFDPDGKRVGVLRGRVRLRGDAAGLKLEEVFVRDLTIVGRDIQALFPYGPYFQSDAVAVGFHDLNVDLRTPALVPDVSWGSFSVLGGAGQVRWAPPQPAAAPEGEGIIERLRDAAQQDGK